MLGQQPQDFPATEMTAITIWQQKFYIRTEMQDSTCTSLEEG